MDVIRIRLHVLSSQYNVHGYLRINFSLSLKLIKEIAFNENLK